MTNSSFAARASRDALATLAGALIVIIAAGKPVGAQGLQSPLQANPSPREGEKRALTIDDYAKWRSIGGSRISGDGNWVVYDLSYTNTNETRPELRLQRLDTGKEDVVPNATNGVFSDDSKWVAYIVTPASGGRGGRGGRGGAAPPGAPGGGGGGGGGGRAGRGNGGVAGPTRHLELRNLATGAVQSFEEVQSFTFSPGSGQLMMRHGGGGGGGGGGRGGRGGAPDVAAAPAGSGTDVVLHDLASGRDQLIGSVGEIAFNQKGDLLAYTVDASSRDANGLFVLDLASGRHAPIDNDARNYSHMTWNDEGTAIAALKGLEATGMRERENVLIVYPDVHAAMNGAGKVMPARLDPATAAGFPKGWVVSDRAALAWSDDDKRVFFGIKAQVAAPDTAGLGQTANVDIWRYNDDRIQSVQMNRATQDLNFTFRSSFEVASSKFVRLADEQVRDVDVSPDGRWVVGRDSRAFISDYERPRADFYRINPATGERTPMMKAQLTTTTTGNHIFGISPDGKYFLYWKDNQFQAYNLDAGTSATITAKAPVNFLDTENDYVGPRPPYGVTGYTSDGKSVILAHRYDQWLVSLDGSEAPRNLTQGVGTRGDIRFGYVSTNADGAPAGGGGRGGRGGGGGRTIDITKPVLLSAYGQWTKKSGFYELRDGQMKELVYEDASYGALSKAAKADKFLLTRQTFAEFPDLRVAGPALKDSKKITSANPQQSEFLWGHRVLFDFTNKKGVRLQGILAIPDDYKQGEKRPMLVNFYEKNSQNMNRYLAPSYLGSLGSLPMEAVTKGYLIMQPDIHFNDHASHSDMLECVEAAVKKVIEMGYADPKHIGLNGHSYSGEGAAFIGTRSRMFAAVGFGAGVTDLTSDFDHNWGWSYQIGGAGSNAFDYYLYYQGRWGTNPWDDPELYRFESARTHVREVTVPFLIMHGTADPTVAFQEGLGMYNALRFNKKEAYLLAYPNEGHGLTNLANRRDLTIRYMQFFDHFLKGAPAPKWMVDGIPFIAKDSARRGDPRH